ncbi:MAG TPA: AmmeMemoRadiSam system protein A [Anaerolineales bacterium]|nr:AmmeMemoRadiSam system protein A [Anaerolineales bacterium]
MDTNKLSPEEKDTLLKIARHTLEEKIRGDKHPPLNAASLRTPLLQSDGASFVTFTINGQLRGCIGTLEPYQPLVDDVREHTLSAALNDYRFPQVSAEELDQIKIEISRLTAPTPLIYTDADDLIAKLRPNIDGVVLIDGHRRATFLPQVWKQLPKTEDFLNHLCQKMGAPADLWMRKKLDVLIYQVEEFSE